MFSRLKVVLANLNAVRINCRKMWTGLKVVLLFRLHVIFDLRSMLCLTASFLIIILTLCIDTTLCSPPKNKTVLTLPPSHPISSGWTSYGTLILQYGHTLQDLWRSAVCHGHHSGAMRQPSLAAWLRMVMNEIQKVKYASPCQISLNSVKSLLSYCDLLVFRMVAVYCHEFLKLKIFAMDDEVKRCVLRHVAKI